MSSRLVFSLIVIFCFGCGEEVDLPVSPDLLVVEGWLTDKDTIHSVRLSRTTNFESNLAVQHVENALVTVRSPNSTQHFHHTLDGIYESNSPFAGIANNEYWIEINLDGQVIRSEWERMKSVPAFDSTHYDFYEQQSEFNSQLEILIYYPVIYISDEGNEDNFYRWRFWKNEELFADPEFIFVQSDRFFNGLDSIKNEFIDFDYRLNDTIRVELQEISFEAYNYLRLLRLQTTSLGTRQGTTPAIINGNLYVVDDPDQVVLGYFGAISVVRDEIIINP